MKTVSSRLRRAAKKFQTRTEVMAVGIGLAYSERRNRFVGRPKPGKSSHWSSLAIKVFVRRKRATTPVVDRLPRTVTLNVGRRQVKFRVDVVTVGKQWPKPRQLQLQAGQVSRALSGVGLVPGHKMELRICPSSTSIPPPGTPLPATCHREIGTVGWLGENSNGDTYVITAAHVIGSVYPPLPSEALLEGEHCVLSFDGKAIACQIPSDQPPDLVPASIRNRDGCIVDVAALRLCYPPPGPEPIIVPDMVDLENFTGQPAYILVERDGQPMACPGTVETILVPSTIMINGVRTSFPSLLMLRFRDERTTEPGDSGAPVLARHNDRLYLLGFHFVEVERTSGQPDFRTASYSIPAHTALRFLNLKPLGS